MSSRVERVWWAIPSLLTCSFAACLAICTSIRVFTIWRSESVCVLCPVLRPAVIFVVSDFCFSLFVASLDAEHRMQHWTGLRAQPWVDCAGSRCERLGGLLLPRGVHWSELDYLRRWYQNRVCGVRDRQNRRDWHSNSQIHKVTTSWIHQFINMSIHQYAKSPTHQLTTARSQHGGVFEQDCHCFRRDGNWWNPPNGKFFLAAEHNTTPQTVQMHRTGTCRKQSWCGTWCGCNENAFGHFCQFRLFLVFAVPRARGQLKVSSLLKHFGKISSCDSGAKSWMLHFVTFFFFSNPKNIQISHVWKKFILFWKRIPSPRSGDLVEWKTKLSRNKMSLNFKNAGWKTRESVWTFKQTKGKMSLVLSATRTRDVAETIRWVQQTLDSTSYFMR